MRRRHDFILFDLDGTLTRSAPGILNGLTRAFRGIGWPVPENKVLRRFIGPPLYEILAELYPDMPRETADAFVLHFRNYYDRTGFAENEVFAGIPELLSSLRDSGALLAVATSKPAPATGSVLEKLHLSAYFDFVGAADTSGRGEGKEKLILPLLEKAGVPAARAVMVGDTKYDAGGARRAGTDFVGVLYGYGTREEMEREGAVNFVNTIPELEEFLIDKS